MAGTGKQHVLLKKTMGGDVRIYVNKKGHEEEVFRKYVTPQADAKNSKMEVDGADHVGVFFSAVLLVLLLYYLRNVVVML